MGEEAWHAARLIPTSGISGADEQERRATSALLAVLTSVKEYGRTITQRAGAPAGIVEAYIEVPFEHDGKRVIPDGLVRVTRGKTAWTALVEVKTGGNELGREQVEAYLDVARANGFDAVLTISNEIRSATGEHPTAVDKRKLRKVALHHLSWTQILSDAVLEKVHRGVADPDQAWILGELIRYLEHPKSGALQFDDMGAHWVDTRNAVRAGTLRPGDPGAAAVVARFDQLLRFACLRLGQELGTEVSLALSRKEQADPDARVHALLEDFTAHGVLSGALRIPDTVGPLVVCADLRAQQLSASVELDAPRQGRNTTRVNWLVRQLKDAPEGLRVESHALRSRTSMAALLREARDNPEVLVEDRTREIRRFQVTMTATLGTKRGTGRGAFITSVLDLLDDFYGQVMQNLKPWAPPAPRLRKPEPLPSDATALSSQDGGMATAPEAGEAAPAAEGTVPDAG